MCDRAVWICLVKDGSRPAIQCSNIDNTSVWLYTVYVHVSRDNAVWWFRVRLLLLFASLIRETPGSRETSGCHRPNTRRQKWPGLTCKACEQLNTVARIQRLIARRHHSLLPATPISSILPLVATRLVAAQNS